jgi:hypothetical protein
MPYSKLIALASMVFVSVVSVLPVAATSQIMKQAKDAGFPAQNCQYCHVTPMPKKEAFKPDDLNERGTWLLGEKGKQKAKDVKGEWLKNYPGNK